MAVSQQPIRKQPPYDYSMLMGSVGAWMVISAIGGFFFCVNGGYSVLGLKAMSEQFNSSGKLFWELISSLTFKLPIAVKELEDYTTQPIIPWVLVLGSSLLQVSLIWRKLSHRTIPGWLAWLGLATTAYDVSTTFYGLGTEKWVADIGWLVQVPLALVFTFALEAIIGFLLRKR